MRYESAKCLINETAAEIWHAFRTCWQDMCLGLPDVVTHDAGTNFASRELAANCDLLHIRLSPVPKESPKTMGIVERQQDPMCRTYMAISKAAPITDVEIANRVLPNLQFYSIFLIACKAVNDAIGTDGLVPNFIVYRAMPRLGASLGEPHRTIVARTQAVR